MLNIIEKSIIEWQHDHRVDGMMLQKEIRDWSDKSLFPQLDDLFLELYPGEKVLRIEKLELWIQVEQDQDWKVVVINKVKEAIKASLEKNMSIDSTKKNIEEKSGDQRTLELILYFLRHGHFPWWSETLSKDEFHVLVEEWLNDPQNAEKARKIWSLAGDTSIRKRMVSQFNEPILESLLWILQDVTPAQINALKEDALALMAITGEQFQPSEFSDLLKTAMVEILAREVNHRWDEVFAQFILDRLLIVQPSLLDDMADRGMRLYSTAFIPVIENIKHGTKPHSSGNKIEPTQPQPVTENEEISHEGIWINNAGLIIVAPFLSTFFERLALLGNGQISDVEKAVASLQFLATGMEEFPEYMVALPKILCGLELDFPLECSGRLTGNEAAEAENLLRAIIKNWSALGEISIEGFRESFLRRKGKLILMKGEWQLQPESAAYDMLLQQIPWTISMVRLPWMKELVRTTWI